jgi:hypothetical protein
MDFCQQCSTWTNVTPFCDACAYRLAAAAMQLGEREHARRDRIGAEQPQSERQAMGEGRDLFRRLYGGRDAVEFLAALYACGLGWRAAPAQAG